MIPLSPFRHYGDGDQPMAAQPLHPPLAALVRADGAWLRCRVQGCGDRAYWGAFRPTAWVLEKAAAHAARVHGAAPVKAPRPQRRNAAAPAAAAPRVIEQGGVLVNLDALAALQGRKRGEGIARQVFDMAGTVRKIAKRGQANHNLAEWHSYMSAPAHLRQWLAAPVMMAADGSWLIAREAEGVGQMAHGDRTLVRDAIGQWCGDLHEFNLGYVDGHPVAIDYADGFNGRTLNWQGA